MVKQDRCSRWQSECEVLLRVSLSQFVFAEKCKVTPNPNISVLDCFTSVEGVGCLCAHKPSQIYEKTHHRHIK